QPANPAQTRPARGATMRATAPGAPAATWASAAAIRRADAAKPLKEPLGSSRALDVGHAELASRWARHHGFGDQQAPRSPLHCMLLYGRAAQLGRRRPTLGNSSAIFAPTSWRPDAGRIMNRPGFEGGAVVRGWARPSGSLGDRRSAP